MNLKQKFKRNKGITLIALVVTIIILLILAGISINMLTGQNGILNRASEAKDKTGISQEEESVKLSISDALTQGLGSITTEDLQTALTNNGLKGPLTGDGPWVYTGDYKKYDIGTSGSMASSDKNNSSSEKIVKLMGNYGVSEDGKFFKMDVDMENLSDETWTEVNKKSELSEIGKIKKSVAYEGMFFVITENGDLYGWGSNWSGQLGIGNTDYQLSPVKISQVSNVDEMIVDNEYGTAYARTTSSKIYCMSEENYLPGIFDVSKQGLNLEENDEICNIDIVKYKGHLLDQVKVINTIQGHMYVYYMISMPA